MKKNIWILLDNRVGSRHQAEGIANYLDSSKFNIIYKEIEYTKWASLPNLIRSNTLLGIHQNSRKTLTEPYPDVVLSASRRTAPVARWIKKQHPQTKLIQLLHIGKIGTKDFTAIFTPEHDSHKYKAPNIHYTIGSPHAITPEKLETAYAEWKETFANLPHPITALIIGGSIKKHPFTLENAKTLACLVKQLKQKDNGSLLITTSRRTGETAQQHIINELRTIPHFEYLWGATGKNPYLGFLACADNIIVTGDSVSMCCEATATGKPLAIFTGTNWLTTKHQRFVQSLYDKKYATSLNSTTKLNNTHTNTPLNIAKELADYITYLSE